MKVTVKKLDPKSIQNETSEYFYFRPKHRIGIFVSNCMDQKDDDDDASTWFGWLWQFVLVFNGRN